MHVPGFGCGAFAGIRGDEVTAIWNSLFAEFVPLWAAEGVEADSSNIYPSRARLADLRAGDSVWLPEQRTCGIVVSNDQLNRQASPRAGHPARTQAPAPPPRARM